MTNQTILYCWYLSYNYKKKPLKGEIVIHKVQNANLCSMFTVWMRYILCPLQTAAVCDDALNLVPIHFVFTPILLQVLLKSHYLHYSKRPQYSNTSQTRTFSLLKRHSYHSGTKYQQKNRLLPPLLPTCPCNEVRVHLKSCVVQWVRDCRNTEDSKFITFHK